MNNTYSNPSYGITQHLLLKSYDHIIFSLVKLNPINSNRINWLSHRNLSMLTMHFTLAKPTLIDIDLEGCYLLESVKLNIDSFEGFVN